MANHTNADLRRDILDSARQIMVHEGFSSLSMRKIARQLGCSPGTIYLYFQNKDSLFYALIDEGAELLYAEYLSVLATYDDPLQRLEGLCRTYIEFGLNNPSYYEIMYLLHPTISEPYGKERYRRATRFLNLTAQTLTDCDQAGYLTVPEPYISATMLWAFKHGLVSLISARRIDNRLERQQLIERTIQHSILAMWRFGDSTTERLKSLKR